MSHKSDVIIIVKLLHRTTSRRRVAASSSVKFDNDYDVIFMTYKCYIAWIAMVEVFYNRHLI